MLTPLELHVAAAAFFLILGMPFDDLAGHDQCLDLSGCRFVNDDCHKHQQSTFDESRFHARAFIESVHMHGDDVNDGRQHHEEEDRQVQNVPEREQALVQRELRNAAGHNGELTNIVS